MITTVQQHIQQEMSEGRGTFGWLMSGITLATKMIEAKIRAAGLTDIYGALGSENGGGGLCALRALDSARVYDGAWGALVHARSNHRCVCPDAGKHEDAGAGQVLQRERSKRGFLA